MSIPASLYQRLPYRVRARMKLDVRVKLENRELTIPTSILQAGKTNLHWARSWKTQVIEALFDDHNGAFVDVGANIGQTLLDLKMIKPHASYIGFEPNSSCVSYLKDLIRLNGLDRCQIFPVGLSDRSMCLPLYRHKDSETDTSASIVADLRPGRSYDVDVVPCFRFDEIMQQIDLGNIDFIKIDVEGAELETLTGMVTSIARYRPVILCEVLFTDSKGDLRRQDKRNAQLMQLLAGLRYQVLQLIKSADTAKVIDLQKIEHFPSGYWSVENKELCDYLFFPQEKEATIRNVIPLPN